jgi:glycosyltransferase involved in cell wall biosynthesis
MRADDITAVILTFNEGPNIGRTLEKLGWLREVVVVDSGSSDETQTIVARFPMTRFVHRRFTTHAEQWNFALEQAGTDWVLALDADFLLTDALVDEVLALRPPQDVAGYQVSFVYCVDGKPLRGTVYPPVVVLFRRIAARYVQDGHTQRVHLNGSVGRLREYIFHDDRKSLSRWLLAQASYMQLEASKLSESRLRDLSAADRVRRLLVVAPVAMFFYCLIVRKGLLDGRAGLFYALQRATAESILSLCLVRHAMSRRTRTGGA